MTVVGARRRTRALAHLGPAETKAALDSGSVSNCFKYSGATVPQEGERWCGASSPRGPEAWLYVHRGGGGPCKFPVSGSGGRFAGQRTAQSLAIGSHFARGPGDTSFASLAGTDHVGESSLYLGLTPPDSHPSVRHEHFFALWGASACVGLFRSRASPRPRYYTASMPPGAG